MQGQLGQSHFSSCGDNKDSFSPTNSSCYPSLSLSLVFWHTNTHTNATLHMQETFSFYTWREGLLEGPKKSFCQTLQYWIRNFTPFVVNQTTLFCFPKYCNFCLCPFSTGDDHSFKIRLEGSPNFEPIFRTLQSLTRLLCNSNCT